MQSKKKEEIKRDVIDGKLKATSKIRSLARVNQELSTQNSLVKKRKKKKESRYVAPSEKRVLKAPFPKLALPVYPA